MKFVQFIPYLDRSEGGPPEVVRQWSRELIQRGHAVQVCYTHSPPREEDRIAGVVYHDLSGCRGIGPLLTGAAYGAVKRVIEGSDHVLLHTAWQPLHLAVRQACRWLRMPYSYMPHGMLDAYCRRQKPIRKSIYLVLAERRVFHGAHRILMTTAGERRQSAGALSDEHPPVAVIPLGVEVPPVMPTDLEARDVVFLGRLHYKKGLERLLRSWALWKGRPDGVCLKIAGRGELSYERRLHRLAAELDIRSSVKFIGELYGPDKWKLLCCARVFVLPSYQENFGLSAAEAMCAGAQVVVAEGVNIASDVVDFGGDVVAEGSDFEERFAKSLAARWVFNDSGRTVRMVRARYRYNWPASVEALLAALCHQ